MADARIFEDLKRDHDRHRQLLDQLAHIQGNGEERRSLFETLRKELQAHAAAEEESLYATMLGCPDLRDEARHSVSEHKESDDKLGELVQTDMDSSSWMEAFGGLQPRYLPHIEEAGEDMFPETSAGLTSAAEGRSPRIITQSQP